MGALIATDPATGNVAIQKVTAQNSQHVMPTSISMGNHYQVIPQAYADQLTSEAKAQGTLKHFTLIASSDHDQMVLPTGEHVDIMTFNGTSPAPTLRVTQGDVVQVTVINNDDEVHSIDFHGAQLSAVPNFAGVAPGDSKVLTFIAVNPGVWAYHCEGNNVFELWEHPLKGMSGMLIVDPKDGYSTFDTNVVDQTNADPTKYTYSKEKISAQAREFSFVYGEDYLAQAAVGGEHDFDQRKMFDNNETYALINGIPYGYLGPLFGLPPWTGKTLQDVTTRPNLDGVNPPLSALVTPDTHGYTAATHLNVKQGEHVRFFIQNNGNHEVAFHIVGEQLDRVAVGNNIMAQAIQTWGIPSYGDATIDVVFENPGVFAIVNHDYSQLFKGQAAIVVVSPAGGPNPSNAVPPMSALPNTSIPQSTCLYGIGPNQQYEGTAINSDDNSFVSQCSS